MTDTHPDQGGPNACIWCNRTVAPGDQAEEIPVEIQDQPLHKQCLEPWREEYERELTPEEIEAELYLQRRTDQKHIQKELEKVQEKLKTEIFALWSRNKDDKYHIGEKLALLQEIHG